MHTVVTSAGRGINVKFMFPQFISTRTPVFLLASAYCMDRVLYDYQPRFSVPNWKQRKTELGLDIATHITDTLCS